MAIVFLAFQSHHSGIRSRGQALVFYLFNDVGRNTGIRTFARSEFLRPVRGLETDRCDKPILFLPTLLKGLLDEEGVAFTVAFGGKFAELPYFGHVLEVLLLQALEQEFSRHSSSSESDILSNMPKEKTTVSAHTKLSKVIQFLDYFPQSRAAVIACARKCEAEMWPTLFEIAGSPRKLFQVRASDSAPFTRADRRNVCRIALKPRPLPWNRLLAYW